MVDKYCPGRLSVRALAYVDDDGKVMSVVGVYIYDGKQVAFMHLEEEIKRKPKWIVKAYKAWDEMARKYKLPLYAVCDMAIPKADVFLKHFGFVHFDGDVWIRR
jgi:hypothetical protein